MHSPRFFSVFYFNHTAPTEIYTLSLHDALPISIVSSASNQRISAGSRRTTLVARRAGMRSGPRPEAAAAADEDRKSTRLNSSHRTISYAVFCLKKKKKNENTNTESSITHSTNLL